MAADHNVQQYQPAAPCQQQQQQQINSVPLTALDTENLERLFPRCRPKHVDTAVLIDLSDDIQMPPVNDSDTSPRRPPSLKLKQSSMPVRRPKYRSESEMRRTKTRRRTVDSWSHYDGAGYEPSPDSEEDGEFLRLNKPVTSNASTSSSSASTRRTVRSSVSESHIVGQWRKSRSSAKEVYDLTPGGELQTDPSRMEIAGGREVVSLSRTRTRASLRKQRHSAQLGDSANNNNNSTASSNRSINRYSGEVYYEESVGRYGFHVGGGNTLWGSQGLEPQGSAGSSHAATPAGAGSSSSSVNGAKRPLSWAGDDLIDTVQDSATSETLLDSKLPESEEVNGRLIENEEPVNPGSFLTDFYPEVSGDVNHDQPAPDPNRPINLDNYLSEQLNQFAQHSRKESNDSEDQQLATVIGGLTIAQYEGSPRRYGVRPHQQASNGDNYSDEEPKLTNGPSLVGPPRSLVPGFPRRVPPCTSTQPHATFSPSATRQTLVELTVSPGPPPVAASTPSSSRHLSWHLEASPPAAQSNSMAGSMADLTDLGETEVGLEVGKSRNFTLSPETTDYEDSELDHAKADTSLSSIPKECDRRGSNHSTKSHNKGQFNSMPILEDGLSSGQSSSESSDESSMGSSRAVSSESEEEETVPDRLPLMADRRKPPPLSVHLHSLQSVNNGCRKPPPHAKLPGQQPLWVKKLPSNDCDYVMRNHHVDPAVANPVQGSFRARDATPPPPAPLAHRPPSVSANNSSTSSSSSSGAGKQASYPSEGSSSGGSPFKSPDAAAKMTSVARPEMNMHELDEALEHERRARKAGSMPPPTGVHSSLARSPPVWVPRQGNDYWVKTSPTSSSSPSARHHASATSANHPESKVNDDDDERETDQLLRDAADDQGFFDTSRPAVQRVAPVSSSPPTPSSMRSASTVSSHPSTPPLPPPALQPPLTTVQATPSSSGGVSIASAAVAALANGSAASGGPAPVGPPAPSRQSEPKDLKYRETTPAAAKKKDESSSGKKKGRSKEVMVHEPAVLIEGVLFRANYLGSTQIVCEGQPTKYTRMMQAEEAVSRIKKSQRQDVNLNIEEKSGPPKYQVMYHGTVEVDEVQPAGRFQKYRTKRSMMEEAVAKLKAPEGETQPATEVDLFISTEKIMVLNTELKEIMMDHALRTISYIADIGDLVVLMARRRVMSQDGEDASNKIAKTPKMVCHVFESEEAQFIAQSIGQAFQVAYMEFLKANGIEDQSFVREMDYQEVLNSQEIFGDELQMFAKKELQKEVIVPKARNEILGVVIVESGWGSMLPTVVIANLAPAGAAARCGQLNIGDQIIAINGISLVGLPLSTCQGYIKNTKSATVVKLTVVPCPPVVEVKIKRPDTKYQLGFSVQNGVICSLLRGGIAERGGVRVGHRIIEINGQSVVAVPHERIVGLLATSVGEINMKTMPTSMFRLLIGQETPVYI